MGKLDGTSRMHLPLSLKVTLMRCIRSKKGTKEVVNAILSDLRVPTIASGTLDGARHTQQSARVLLLGFFQVLRVIAQRSWSEICDSIIVSNIVDMVDVLIGKRAINIKPSQSVRMISLVINADDFVSVTGASSTCCCSSLPASFINTPRKNPSFRIVMQNFAQTLGSERMIQFSHDALRKLIGQGTEYVEGIFGPRHYTPIFREVIL